MSVMGYDIRCEDCGQPLERHTSSTGGGLVCPSKPLIVPLEGSTWKWVRVSTELLAEMNEWSEPVQVQIVADENGILEMTFRREPT